MYTVYASMWHLMSIWRGSQAKSINVARNKGYTSINIIFITALVAGIKPKSDKITWTMIIYVVPLPNLIFTPTNQSRKFSIFCNKSKENFPQQIPPREGFLFCFLWKLKSLFLSFVCSVITTLINLFTWSEKLVTFNPTPLTPPCSCENIPFSSALHRKEKLLNFMKSLAVLKTSRQKNWKLIKSFRFTL